MGKKKKADSVLKKEVFHFTVYLKSLYITIKMTEEIILKKKNHTIEDFFLGINIYDQ